MRQFSFHLPFHEVLINCMLVYNYNSPAKSFLKYEVKDINSNYTTCREKEKEKFVTTGSLAVAMQVKHIKKKGEKLCTSGNYKKTYLMCRTKLELIFNDLMKLTGVWKATRLKFGPNWHI